MSVCSLSLPPIEIKLIQFDQEPNHIQRRINCKLILIVVVQNANTNKKKLKKKNCPSLLYALQYVCCIFRIVVIHMNKQ